MPKPDLVDQLRCTVKDYDAKMGSLTEQIDRLLEERSELAGARTAAFNRMRNTLQRRAAAKCRAVGVRYDGYVMLAPAGKIFAYHQRHYFHPIMDASEPSGDLDAQYAQILVVLDAGLVDCSNPKCNCRHVLEKKGA